MKALSNSSMYPRFLLDVGRLSRNSSWWLQASMDLALAQRWLKAARCTTLAKTDEDEAAGCMDENDDFDAPAIV